MRKGEPARPKLLLPLLLDRSRGCELLRLSGWRDGMLTLGRSQVRLEFSKSCCAGLLEPGAPSRRLSCSALGLSRDMLRGRVGGLKLLAMDCCSGGRNGGECG
jgi:hypothetical protein